MVIVSRVEARRLGLAAYFTGLPCRNGHLAFRNVTQGKCRECQRDRSTKWYANNSETHQLRCDSWAARNPEKDTLARQRYRRVNRDSEKARKQAWIAANGDRDRERQRLWREANPGAVRLKYKKWAASNPDVVLANNRNRRARESGAVGRHTAVDVDRIRAGQHGKCGYCKTKVGPKNQAVDHIIPLALGGGNEPSNLQILCARCNGRKAAKHPADFARSLGMLL